MVDRYPGVDQGYVAQLRQKMDKGEDKAQAKAGMELVLTPDSRRQLSQRMLDLEEDDPQVHATRSARTRDIDFSIDLVCLHRDGDGLYVFAGSGDKLKAELDDLLDEIDEVLETNAEDFVKSYVQKGGQ